MLTQHRGTPHETCESAWRTENTGSNPGSGHRLTSDGETAQVQRRGYPVWATTVGLVSPSACIAASTTFRTSARSRYPTFGAPRAGSRGGLPLFGADGNLGERTKYQDVFDSVGFGGHP